jgi:hypothetical protein
MIHIKINLNGEISNQAAYLCFGYPLLSVTHDLSSLPTDSAVKLAPAKPTDTSPSFSQTSTSK